MTLGRLKGRWGFLSTGPTLCPQESKEGCVTWPQLCSATFCSVQLFDSRQVLFFFFNFNFFISWRLITLQLGKFLNNCKLLHFPICKSLQGGLWWLQETRFVKYTKCEVHALWTARKLSFLTSGMGILAVTLQDGWTVWLSGWYTPQVHRNGSCDVAALSLPSSLCCLSPSHHFCSLGPACLTWAYPASAVTVRCSHGLLCSHPKVLNPFPGAPHSNEQAGLWPRWYIMSDWLRAKCQQFHITAAII